MCSFLRTLQGHDCVPVELAALLIQGNGTTQTPEGIKPGSMHAPAATTGCRQPTAACFKTFGTCNPLPRNPHVAFHIPNLGGTLSTSPALPDLAWLQDPSGPRIGQWSKKQSRSDELKCGQSSRSTVGHIQRRETDPGFTTHHTPSTWTCLGLPGLRNHGSTAEPASHCRLAAPSQSRDSSACATFQIRTFWLFTDRSHSLVWQLSVKFAKQTHRGYHPFGRVCLGSADNH